MTKYHVSVTGNDKNIGSEKQPFRTINKAAQLAEAGDTVIVHEGVYREWVNPVNSGRSNSQRITYEAAEGEKVIIKGSEEISDWEPTDKGVWCAVIPNSVFGSWNPYVEVIDGDWYMEPIEHSLHTGQVYINGVALDETDTIENLYKKAMTWHSETENENTVIYANFDGFDLNKELTEINARKCCFYPEQIGVNYITVRGFEMAHAACPWAPPTANQPGMLGANWSKGWIIEDNILHDARCSAVSVGKEISTGHNFYSRYHLKAGYQYQLEVVFRGLHIGWSKERIGSHIIRNNTIYDCGQNGIVGHMGGAFSEIYGNHIYNIGNKHEFFGYEIAGIKLHAAIDTYIHNNYIHDCRMGTWLDWEAQGVRLSSNLYHSNEEDLWIEVTHGPHTVDNNIFASKWNFTNSAQGGAYIHNLFCGGIKKGGELRRSTPYHLSHSTEIMGCAVVYGDDDRYYQNIFAHDLEDSQEKLGWENWVGGTVAYNGCPSSVEEYVECVIKQGRGDIEKFLDIRQPAYINGNCYMDGVKSYDREIEKYSTERDSEIKIYEENGSVYLDIYIPEDMFKLNTEIIETKNLELTRISELPYDSPDGSDMRIDTDYFKNARSGKPIAGPFENLKPGYQKILVWKHHK